MLKYDDFRVDLGPHDGHHFDLRVTSRHGETTSAVRVPLGSSELDGLLATAASLASKRLPGVQILELGRALGALLLPSEVRPLLLRALDAPADTEGIRMRLVVQEPRLASLPWEYVYVNGRSGHTKLKPFLLLDRRISMVRHEPQSAPVPSTRPLKEGTLRVLVCPATVLPQMPTPGDDFVSAIADAVGSADPGANIQLTCLPNPVTIDAIASRLSAETFDVVHFIGHGLANDDGGGLVVSDGADGIELLGSEQFADLLRRGDVRVALLNACDTGARGVGPEWSGMAGDLVRTGLPAVVAMQSPIEASHALAFQEGLLSGLAAALTLDEAVAAGRRRINQLGILPDWGVPVLHTRSDGVIFSPGGQGAQSLRQSRQDARAVTHDNDISAALVLEENGDWRKAAAIYQRALDHGVTGREEVVVLHRLGACLWRNGDSDDAEEILGQAQQRATGLGDQRLLGEILLELGEQAEEEDQLDDAQRWYERAAIVLRDDPAIAFRVELRMASFERRSGHLRSALDRVLRIDVDELTQSQMADYRDTLGSVYLARGQYSDAIEELELALRLDESINTDHQTSGTRLLLAEAYLAKGHRKEAHRQIDLAIDAYEDSNDEQGLSDAYAMRGQIFEDAGEYQKALTVYRQASQYDVRAHDSGGEARAYRLLGRTARKRGDMDAAEDHFENARLKLRETNDDIERAALLTEEAMLDVDEGNFDRAITKLEEALDIAMADEDDRAIAIAKKNLATALREDGNARRAVELLAEARTVLEDRGDLRELERLLDELGESYLDLGRFGQAEEALLASDKLDEQLDTARGRVRTQILLGRVYYRTGERRRAADNLQRALDICETAEDNVGISEARYWLGLLAHENGQIREARMQLTRALQIDRRMVDRLGAIRCCCALAAVFRRGGDLARAHESLAEAISELKSIDDPMERATLDLERAHLQMAEGDTLGAIETARAASLSLQTLGNLVLAASCDRLQASGWCKLRDYEAATRLLENALAVFDQAFARTELSETYDDFATLHLMNNNLPAARTAIERSLEIDRNTGWRSSLGRSLLLLAEVELRDGKPDEARRQYLDALDAFLEAEDEIGQANVHARLGNWHLDGFGKTPQASLEEAVKAFKAARSFYLAHRDHLGLGICYRKLGEVYFARGESERAQEAFEQAADNLGSVTSTEEKAALAFAQGKLYSSRNDHQLAIASFERALNSYRDLKREDKVTELLRRLATAYQNANEIERSLDCIRQIGLEQSRLWSMLLEAVHEDVATRTRAFYRDGKFADSIAASADVIGGWLRDAERADPQSMASPPALAFGHEAVELLRTLLDDADWQPSSLDAICAIAVAHLAGTVLDPTTVLS